MKSIIILLSFILAFNISVYSGKDCLSLAARFADEYSIDNMLGKTEAANHKLLTAKENIDLAIKHPEYMYQAKTWYYHGLIYFYLGSNEYASMKEYKIGALEISVFSFEKALFMDREAENYVEILCCLKQVASCLTNNGFRYYDSRDYENAIDKLEAAIKANEIINRYGWTAPGIQNELSMLVKSYYQTRDYDRMLFYGNVILNKEPDNYEVYYLMQTVYESRGYHYDKAEIIAIANKQSSSGEQLVMN